MPGNVPNIYQMARKEGRMTQERAAELLHVSDKTVKAWEAGQRLPDNTTVARMAEIYRTPRLRLEHAMAESQPLGVLPKIEPKSLVMSSVALENRLREITDQIGDLMRIAEDDRIDKDEQPEFDNIEAELWRTMAAIYQVIFAAANGRTKKERPEAGTSRRPVQGLRRELKRDNYSTHSAQFASPSFTRRGGGSL